MSSTIIVQGARLELLRVLDRVEQHDAADRAASAKAGKPFPTHYPLFGPCRWSYHLDDVLLAAKECERIGHIDVQRKPAGWLVCITNSGRAWITEHDAREVVTAAARRAAFTIEK
jgi:hypothetical protein